MSEPGTFSDPVIAMAVRDYLKKLIIDVLNTERPADRIGTVTAVDETFYTANVTLVDNSEIKARLGSIIPDVGDVVRLTGKASSAWVEDVLGVPSFRT